MAGFLQATFQQAFAAGCIQTGADYITDVAEAEIKMGLMYAGLMTATDRDICDGCPKDKPSCEAHCLYYLDPNKVVRSRSEGGPNPPVAVGTKQFPGLSIKQIAEKLGISKNETRRRKQSGIL